MTTKDSTIRDVPPVCVVLTMFVTIVTRQTIMPLPRDNGRNAPLYFPILNRNRFTTDRRRSTTFHLNGNYMIDLGNNVTNGPSTPLNLTKRVVIGGTSAHPPRAINTISNKFRYRLRTRLLNGTSNATRLFIHKNNVNVPISLLAMEIDLRPKEQRSSPINNNNFRRDYRATISDLTTRRALPKGKYGVRPVGIIFRLRSAFLIFSRGSASSYAMDVVQF